MEVTGLNTKLSVHLPLFQVSVFHSGGVWIIFIHIFSICKQKKILCLICKPGYDVPYECASTYTDIILSTLQSGFWSVSFA